MRKLIVKLSLLNLAFICSYIILLNACSYSSSETKKLLNQSLTKKYDLIIVPGIWFKDNKWDYTMKGRIYWSKYLYDKGIAKNIMYSGSSVYSPYYEAEIMSMYAQAIGIPKEHIFVEKKAEHSTENAFYSYRLAKKLGFQKIAIASDPFQTKSLRRFARLRLSPDVGLLPIVYDTLASIQSTMTDPVIDFQKAYNKDFVSLKDRESFWKRLRGTMGRNLDTTAYR